MENLEDISGKHGFSPSSIGVSCECEAFIILRSQVDSRPVESVEWSKHPSGTMFDPCAGEIAIIVA